MEPGTFSRALPRYFEHPRRYPTISPSDFDAMQKEQVEAAPAACPGHAGTRIWYFEQPDRRGYIVEVMFQSSESVYVQTPCTFTPTFCMDRIDGMLAQDAEEWVLSNRLGFETTRMKIFGDADRMESLQYLADRGLPEQLQNVMTLSGLPQARPEFVVNPPAETPVLESRKRSHDPSINPPSTPAQAESPRHQQPRKRWWQFWRRA